jgi:hypothetical protein
LEERRNSLVTESRKKRITSPVHLQNPEIRIEVCDESPKDVEETMDFESDFSDAALSSNENLYTQLLNNRLRFGNTPLAAILESRGETRENDKSAFINNSHQPSPRLDSPNHIKNIETSLKISKSDRVKRKKNWKKTISPYSQPIPCSSSRLPEIKNTQTKEKFLSSLKLSKKN